MAQKVEGTDIMDFLRPPLNTAVNDQTKQFDAKKYVWVPDEVEGYKAATVIETKGDKFIVETIDNKKLEFDKDNTQQMNPPKFDKAENMAILTYLNEGSVLYNLKSRYTSGYIYTYSGLFCVAVNPYRKLPIYSDEIVSKYRGKRRTEMPPHIFAVVDHAYQNMLNDKENQSILITGESGAGKTENTKKVIQYVAKVSGVEKRKDEEKSSDLDDQIVQANPLLEAFGNAKTIRNNNSSRFGKFIRTQFSGTGKLAGADIQSYLLEKSRVVKQGKGERNFHIFYQILYGSGPEWHKNLLIESKTYSDYEFLKLGAEFADNINDTEEWQITLKAFDVLGYSKELVRSVLNICIGILFAGNMKFKQRPREEQAEMVDTKESEKLSYLWGIPAVEFAKSLLRPRMLVGKEYVQQGRNVEQVINSVSALSKLIYDRMFVKHVAIVNKTMDTKRNSQFYIGVLDIAGFEIFEYNSFEQLCINFTNERLQQLFNHTMFVSEQDEYRKEGVPWDYINFGLDLEPTIDLIGKGILPMLEEECIVPKASDDTLLQKLHKCYDAKNPKYRKAKVGSKSLGDFEVVHYAGTVHYSVSGWLDKNKDPVNEAVAALLAKSTDAFVASLFSDYDPGVTGGRRKGSAFQTLSSLYKDQLNSLMDTLYKSDVQFIRCIIPNESKKAGIVEGPLILHQLKCNGVLEGIRICRKGFPNRMLFLDFKQRYQILTAQACKQGFLDSRKAAEIMLEALQLEKTLYYVGSTKVFFKAGVVGTLEDLRDEKLSQVICQFQAICKGLIMRKAYKKLVDQRVAVTVIQRNTRKYLQLRDWSWWKLFTRVKPLLNIARAEEEMREKENELKKAQEKAIKEEQTRKELDEKVTKMSEERQTLITDLNKHRELLEIAEVEMTKAQEKCIRCEREVVELSERIEEAEKERERLIHEKNNMNKQSRTLSSQLDEAKINLDKAEATVKSNLSQMDSLNKEIKNNKESMEKLNKEKNTLNEQLQEATANIQLEQDKVNHLNKQKTKLESTIQELEEYLSREKNIKADVEKHKRRLEGEIKTLQDNLCDLQTQKRDLEDSLSKRDKTINECNQQLESDKHLIAQLQKKIQQLEARIEELNDELDNERKAKQKVERQKVELQNELVSLGERLEEAGGSTAIQMELNKKHQEELSRIQAEMNEQRNLSEQVAAKQRQKFQLTLTEITEELETAKKAKSRAEKETTEITSEVQSIQEHFDLVNRQKMAAEKQYKALEEKNLELKQNNDTLINQLNDTNSAKIKLTNSISKLEEQLEESENKTQVLLRAKKQIEIQFDDLKRLYDNEVKLKQEISLALAQFTGIQASLQEQLEEAEAQKLEFQSKYAKTNSELQQLKTKFESEGVQRLGELEDAKKKLTNRLMEVEENQRQWETKCVNLEKNKSKLETEIDDLTNELSNTHNYAASLEKKQKKFDALINEWKIRYEEATNDAQKWQRESNVNSAELLKYKEIRNELIKEVEQIQKEKTALTNEIRALSDKSDDGGKAAHELEKLRYKMELEKEELSQALEAAELSLEQEQGKLVKLQLESNVYKSDVERKFREKDEEIESVRRNFQRQVDSMQAIIDQENRTKQEMAKSRRGVEADVAALQAELEEIARQNGELQKAVRKWQQAHKELQSQCEDEIKRRDEYKDGVVRAERRIQEMQVDIESFKGLVEQAERARKVAESDRNDWADRINELTQQNNQLLASKKRLEADCARNRDILAETDAAARRAEDTANKAAADAQKFQQDLAMAVESLSNAEKARGAAERSNKELLVRIDELEQGGARALKAQLKQAENKTTEIQLQLEEEMRKHADTSLRAKKSERRQKELQAQIDDLIKTQQSSQDTIKDLNLRLKKLKTQLQESEDNCAANMAKYRKALCDLEDSEHKTKIAEDTLMKYKAQSSRRLSSPGGGSITGRYTPIPSRGTRSPLHEED